jgi:hypothetical protein
MTTVELNWGIYPSVMTPRLKWATGENAVYILTSVKPNDSG